MATSDDLFDVPISPIPGTSSNYGSPNGSRPDLDGMDQRAINAKFKEIRDMLPQLARGFADFDNHVKAISEAVGAITSRVTNVEQTVNALVLQMSALSLHVFARFNQMQLSSLAAPDRQDLGIYLDTVTAPQPLGPLGPMALRHLMTTEIQDVDLIRLQALMTNRHEVPYYYDSHASNIPLELWSGSITSWKSRHRTT